MFLAVWELGRRAVLLQLPLVTATSRSDVGQQALAKDLVTELAVYLRACFNENDFCLAHAREGDRRDNTAAEML